MPQVIFALKKYTNLENLHIFDTQKMEEDDGFPLKNWVIQFEVPCSFCRVYTPSLPQKGKRIVSQTKIRTFDVDLREGTTTKLVGG